MKRQARADGSKRKYGREPEMENSIYIGLSRQAALEREMAMVANNIANLNTTAFKRELGVYDAYESQPRRGDKMDFVIDHGSAVSFEPGSSHQTNNQFDVALAGPGFFVVDDGTGSKYTRNGSFTLDNNNTLVTREGFQVLTDANQPILVPNNGSRVEISPDGTITAGAEALGKIKVVEFDSLHLMQKRGNSMFETREAEKPPQNTTILQGALEGSNVSGVKELTRMIEVSRAYEGVKAMLDREAERQRTTVQRLSRPNAA
jgi:flagellar basal-body rod protein FlgF